MNFMDNVYLRIAREKREGSLQVTTNAQFAHNNTGFREACSAASMLMGWRLGFMDAADMPIKPTKRQASKYRRGLGAAWKAMNL